MYGWKTEHRGQLNIWGWTPGRGALCLIYGGSLCFETSASGEEKACSGLISLRQRHTQTAGGGSRFARACSVHKENGRISLNEGCPGILKPTQLSSLHIYEAELLEGSGRG